MLELAYFVVSAYADHMLCNDFCHSEPSVAFIFNTSACYCWYTWS